MFKPSFIKVSSPAIFQPPEKRIPTLRRYSDHRRSTVQPPILSSDPHPSYLRLQISLKKLVVLHRTL
ncbi:hypothetical protein HanRHA438_Chr17g0840541 [Helianthus annuus]|nr:hypothetical protein HanRHA438_Chr17g0840541 [Helianthus annuus]